MNAQPAVAADLAVLAGLAPELAAAFASIAVDIALVIDGEGVVRNIAVNPAGPGVQTAGWLDRPWIDTVTGGTRRKIELLLQEAAADGIARRREVNHPPAPGDQRVIPFAYSGLRLGRQGPVVVVGRDLRAAAAIQQRFLEAQRDMEREYWRMRLAQARKRVAWPRRP